ncbi:MAG TPA: acyloxyacyl hydrolase [Longimicrobiales bacterium]|nr:acyloxyacyl hydrolase [Longimicrobiales bacterium]
MRCRSSWCATTRSARPSSTSNATRFNFAYDMAAGIRMEVPRAGRAELGLRRQHLSNAGFGEVNPGLDSHVAYIGFWVY